MKKIIVFTEADLFRHLPPCLNNTLSKFPQSSPLSLKRLDMQLTRQRIISEYFDLTMSLKDLFGKSFRKNIESFCSGSEQGRKAYARPSGYHDDKWILRMMDVFAPENWVIVLSSWCALENLALVVPLLFVFLNPLMLPLCHKFSHIFTWKIEGLLWLMQFKKS